MNINKKQILETFFRILEHVSDKDYQKRVWIRGEGSEVDDFDETVCHFSQEGDGIIEKYQDFGLTEHQCQVLKNFREQFKAFADKNDFPEEFIETPEWAHIIDLAKNVLRVFNLKKS